jgi:hypothetical protein
VRLKSPPANRRYSNGLSIQVTRSQFNVFLEGPLLDRPGEHMVGCGRCLGGEDLQQLGAVDALRRALQYLD